jgi:hypothetical protein
MDSPQDLDFIPKMDICVHEIGTQLHLGAGPDGVMAVLTFTGHDEDGQEMTVSGMIPGCMMDMLSTRLQEHQMAASMTGIHTRVSPGVFRRLRSVILERRDEGHSGHGH